MVPHSNFNSTYNGPLASSHLCAIPHIIAYASCRTSLSSSVQPGVFSSPSQSLNALIRSASCSAQSQSSASTSMRVSRSVVALLTVYQASF